MQRITVFCRNISQFNPPAMSFILKNLNKPHPYSSIILRCLHQNLKTVGDTRSSNKYPLLFAFTLAGIWDTLRFPIEKNEFNEFNQLIMKGEKAFLEKKYKLSEQLFHEALQLAQKLENETGITYVYDRLANIALENGDYRTAKKLFTAVMERLFSVGTDENDIQMLNISFKLAKCLEHIKKYRDADLGYQYCIQRIKDHHLIEDNLYYKDAQEFLLKVLTSFAYFNYNRGRLKVALHHFEEAYELCLQMDGEKGPETIMLLNNIGIIAKEQEVSDLAYIYLNLGFIYLENKMFNQAERYCNDARKLLKKIRDKEAVEEANLCLSELKKVLK